MSMLTPPGMGGKKYRITGDRYPRMRRPRHRRRIVLTIVAAVCALGLAGWGTLQLIDVFGGKEDTAQAAHAKKCREEKGRAQAAHGGAGHAAAGGKPLPRPATITVNVFNATARGGLAKSTADELKKRGFKVGKVGNAPPAYDKKVKGTGLLLGPQTAAEGSLRVLGTQLAGAEHKTDGRKTGDVDLIIGDTFKQLAKRPDADAALAALSRPSPAPSASAC
ncbi:LytR C-terminal domain-containing protein [Streptomyces sp. MST-110588]|uniref:LytR C-terminal domain-containing protein n=1 Tax=Streptomyces sp. MST-110588 TaxID=2833628 RepID=UPI001F5D8E82|nr:LytR C-terminal domain-containing protein [Streptomyces sp. MST-110588]UNO40818.1 LytR C-terminal domain-containing protein [Streptomyces sp. MST-110588]